MTRFEFLGEIAACASMMVMLVIILVFGTAMMPRQHSMHSEASYREAGQ